MNELARLPEGQALSELQARFVDALLGGAEPDEAKIKAGYSETTPTISILRSKLVENAISAVCDARLRGPMKLKALNALDKLLDDAPAATKLQAAKLVLDHAEEGGQKDDRPLAERSVEELERMIDSLQAARDGAMKDVTPKNGA